MTTSGEGSSLAALMAETDEFISSSYPVSGGGSLEQHFEELVRYQRALHAAGLAVVAWPTEVGGRGLKPSEAAAVAQRLGEAGMPELINFVGIEVLAPAMLAFLDESRLRRWLPPMAAADEIWCQLFSEPDAGSDLANLSTRAVAEGGGWRVSGNKVWSTWGQFAQWGLLLARTGEPETRHRGISAFVVDMSTPGIDVRPLRTMTGEAEFAEVFFDGVFLGPLSLVGRVDRGWDVALHILGSERGPYAVRRASLLRASLGRLLADARRQKPTGHRRSAVVDAVISMRLLDHRIRKVALALEDGQAPGADAALTKLLLTEAEQRIATAAHGLCGVGGIAWEPEGPTPAAVGSYLYSRAASIYGGTSQIQRNIIGERVLGLPR